MASKRKSARHSAKPSAVEQVSDLAVTASHLLAKFGPECCDWQEWTDLKNDLLKVHPFLLRYAQEAVSASCTAFIEARRQLDLTLEPRRKRRRTMP